MVGVGLVRERRLVARAETMAVVAGRLVVPIAVMRGLDILLA